MQMFSWIADKSAFKMCGFHLTVVIRYFDKMRHCISVMAFRRIPSPAGRKRVPIEVRGPRAESSIEKTAEIVKRHEFLLTNVSYNHCISSYFP